MTTAGAGVLNYRFNATVVIPKNFILLRNRSHSGRCINDAGAGGKITKNKHTNMIVHDR